MSHALDPHVASFRISSLMHVRRPFDCIEAALVRTYGDGMKKCGSGANLPSQMPRAYGHIFPCARTHGKWLMMSLTGSCNHCGLNNSSSMFRSLGSWRP